MLYLFYFQKLRHTEFKGFLCPNVLQQGLGGRDLNPVNVAPRFNLSLFYIVCDGLEFNILGHNKPSKTVKSPLLWLIYCHIFQAINMPPDINLL